jgi:uncharacterized protein (TIGR03437 family)
VHAARSPPGAVSEEKCPAYRQQKCQRNYEREPCGFSHASLYWQRRGFVLLVDLTMRPRFIAVCFLLISRLGFGACIYTVSPLAVDAPASGGDFTLSVQTDVACNWSVSGLPSWISIPVVLSGFNSGTVPLTVAANTGAGRAAILLVANKSVTVTQAAAGSSAPVITAVVSGASFTPGVTANAYITIMGSGLSPVTGDWSNAIMGGKLPVSLNGVSVSIGGQPAYIEYVSPGQINAIAPDLPPGTVQVTVSNAQATSAPFTANATVFGPAFFPWPGGYAVATHLDFSYAAKNGTLPGQATIPAKPGEAIILWGTGFGPASPSAPVGSLVPAGSILSAANPVTVTVGSVAATVYGVALTPGLAGTFQVAIQIPPGLPNGDYPVIAAVAGVQSPVNAVTGIITVQQ